MVVTKVIILRR